MGRMLEKATLAAGCFWCAEAIFKRLKGVKRVVSGYAGAVRVESIQIEFDPTEVSYRELLDVFWSSHDPTQTGGQGADIGPQYQAAIFYHNEKQKKFAEESKKRLEESGPVATQILPYKNFFKAEEHHQNYFEKNPHAPYCQVVIKPKLEKIEKLYYEKFKD